MHKIKLAAVFMAVVLPAGLYSQTIDTISFVPVKHGFYENISTKSMAHLASATGTASMESLNVYSNTLDIVTGQVNFGKDVYVGGNASVFGVPSTEKTANRNNVQASTLSLGGDAVVGDSLITDENVPRGNAAVAGVNFSGSSRVSALTVDTRNSALALPDGAAFIVDGVEVLAPDCPIDNGEKKGAQWVETEGWMASGGEERFFKLLAYGCSGTAREDCEVSDRDEKACTSAGNSWDRENCCCSGTKISNFFDGAEMCSDIGNNAMCNGNNVVSLDAVCNQYGASSAQCICARNIDKSVCIKAIYGATSDEAKCTASSTKWPCTCPNIQWLLGSGNDTRNYACRFPKGAKQCELACSFPMVKEKEWGYGDWKCVCMDPYLFGNYGSSSGNNYGPKCAEDYPYSYNFKGCCCGNYYDYNSGGMDNNKSFVAKNPNIYGYAYSYYQAVQNGGTPPTPSCPTQFNREDLLSGGGYGYGTINANWSNPCSCGSGGY